MTLSNESTGHRREAVSNEDGIYSAALLPLGPYTVRVQAPGFRVTERTGLELSALQSLRVDFLLELGDVTETVTVTGEAVQVDTRSPSQGMLIDDRRVRDLPLNGRNVLDLTSLIPGVNRLSTTVRASYNQQRLFLNGTRDTSVSFLMDGSSVNYSHRGRGLNLPPPDAVQEFKILTAGIDAEYGRGASVMSAVTRSGTNDFHGSAWEFLRNDALDARNFFSENVPKLRFNQFGATAGGPIRQNKTFFFGSYQGLRIREDELSTGAFPPTAAELAGDFSASGRVITDPQTGQPFPGNRIPVNRFDPVALRLLEFVRQPNRPNGSYVEQASTTNNADQFMARIDHQITQRNQLTGRYFQDFNRSLEPFSGSDFTGYNGEEGSYRQQTLTVEDTHIFGTKVVQTARFTFNEFDYHESNTQQGDLTTFGATDFVHAGGPVDTRPNIAVSGRFGLGVGRDRQRLHDNWGFADTVAVTQGDHQLKFGFTAEANRFYYTDNNKTGGSFDFNGSRTGEPFADFLQGLPRRFDQASPFATNQKYTYIGLFAQDAWRIHPRLTASLGLRAEIFNAWREDNGQISSFVAGAQSARFPTAPVGLLFQGDKGFPYQRDANNLGPRVGLAWDVFGDGRTAVRSSFGIYYDALTAEMAGGVSAPQPFGLTLRVNTPESLSRPYAGRDNPFPFTVDPQNAQFVTPIQIDKSFNPDLGNPYIMSWTTGVQQQLTDSLMLDVAYVGNGGRHQILLRELNPAIYGPGATVGNTNERRSLYPDFGSIGQLYSDGISYYHALQAQLNKRFSKGLTFSANYTWSKTIDEGGTGNSFANEGQQGYQSPFDRRQNRGPSEIDVRHRVAGSWLYELPFLKQSSGWVKGAFGGWELGGIVTLQTGKPIALFSGQDNSLSGIGNDRPDVIGDPNLSNDRPRAQLIDAWFNTAAFAPNPIGQFGTAGRGIVYGPGAANIDMSLRKSFRIREGHALQVRWEAFNALNHVNLGDPEGDLNQKGFGRITSASSARIMQVSLKYTF